MKRVLLVLFVFAFISSSAQNMAINNDGSSAHSKAILELKSTDKGFLIPRMTQVQRLAIFSSPDATAKAMLVYQTDGAEGYYYYDGSTWKCLQAGGNGWDITGNSGTNPASNFLGTTDNQPLVFKTNNGEVVRILSSGYLGIGTSTPNQKLQVMGNINIVADSNYRINNARVLSIKGTDNLFVGENSGTNNTTGDRNTFIGKNAGANNTTGSANIAVGQNALMNLNAGTWNTGVGVRALQNLTDGFSNSAFGIGTLTANTTGYRNTAVGGGGLESNTTGSLNTAVGYYSFHSNTTGNYNTGFGLNSGYNTTTGSYNVFAGNDAGNSNTTGTYNTAIGYNAQAGATLTNASAIGANASVTTSNSLVLGATGANAVNVGIGTTAPQVTLDVQTNSTTGSQQLRLTENEGTDYTRIGYYTSGKSDFWETTAITGTDNTSSYYHIFRSGGAGNLLTVRGDANVGISNANPTHPLTFSNSLGSKISLWTGSSSNFGLGVQTKLLQLYTAAQADDIAFGYGSSGSFTENMRIMGTGNVGIGTSTPDNKLQVMGNINIVADSNYRINNTRVLSIKGGTNLFTGANAGINNTTGANNTFSGYQAGYTNADGSWNTFTGIYSGYNNTSGHRNTFIGAVSGNYNTTGAWNTFVGTDAGQRNTTGNSNTGLGFQSAYYTTGNNNVFIGRDAGFNNTTGSSNTALGYNAQTGTTLSNATAIGANASVTTSNSLVLGGTGVNAVSVGIGTTAPAAELHVNGFTKLGDDAPAIKTKKLTGTLSATQGVNNLFPHGLTSTKILSVSVLVEYSSGNYVPANYTVSPGYEFNYVITSTNVIVVPISGNSGTIVSKAVKILITYEE